MVLTCIRPHDHDRTSARVDAVELECVPVAVIVTVIVNIYVV